MCGITGFTHARHRADVARIRAATQTLAHRGPDQQGVYQSDFASLGAVRLKVIDLEHGDQPMRSADGDVCLVFNGEIYNNTELREELRRLGHNFHSHCDTEVVLEAFREWDVDAFARLRGMFALGIWTESKRRLVLARDRMGIKPLYIHRRGENLYFGSELKAILEHPEVERRLNSEALSHYLSLNYVPSPHTLVEGIEKLPAAQWLEWRGGKTRTQAYWRLEFHPDDRMDLEAAKNELDGLLRESVRENMAADVPVGIWASGGLDSSTILHYASELRDAGAARLNTFSVSFAGRSFDESVYFREAAARYGTEHHEFDLNTDVDLETAIEEIVYHSDEPGADAGALPVWFLSRMTREHVTVALSGEGADEIFGGYNTYLADSYARRLRGVPNAALRLASMAAGYLPASDEKIGFDYKLKRFLAGSQMEPAEAHLFWNGTFSEAEKQRLQVRNGHPRTGALAMALPAAAGPVGSLNRFLWLDQQMYLPDDILYKCDRMSMAHSLEVRPPFLDHRIVEFAARLPENFKVRGGNLKFVLRELMKDKLPRTILRRKKEGFDIPAHHWMRTALAPLLAETLNERAVRASGLFHWHAVEELIRNHRERRANLGYHLWGLLVLFLWMKRWGIQPAAEPEESEIFSTVSVTS
ncbi:MAG: asparagine synthase (glutamine-hydrolyzing) [Bryobacteraceae bacterium]